MEINNTIRNKKTYNGEPDYRIISEGTFPNYWRCLTGPGKYNREGWEGGHHMDISKDDAEKYYIVIDGGRAPNDIPFQSLGYSDYLNPELRMMHPVSSTEETTRRISGTD